MPQLLSRRDDAGWLTPSMADILVQRTTPLPPEETLRAQVSIVQQRLADLDSPVRVVDLRPSPSHTLLVARPDTRRNRQLTPKADIRRNLGKIAEENTDWTLGYLPEMPDDDESVGILIRTPQNQPVRLRQVLLSNTFQHHDSTLALVMGVALGQQVVVHDLEQTGHLLALGPYNSRSHLIKDILLTLIMLNTPAELRLAILGETGTRFTEFSQTPHILGRLIDAPEDGQRLLDGLMKEAQRRRQWFLENQTEDLDNYNTMLGERGETPLPRIIVLLDSLSDEQWQNTSESWAPAVYDLLVNGARVGIHVLLTAEDPVDVPEILADIIDARIVTRSVSPELAEDLPYLHNTALRFIDAFFVKRGEQQIPVELCTVGDQDIQNLVSYWRQMATQRMNETTRRERTGLTDLLPELEGSGLGATEQPRRTTGQLPTRTRAGTLARATQVLSGESDDTLIARSMTLAAYLGWLGVGPISDIFGVSSREALAVLALLQSRGVLEEGDGPVYRFLRLTDNPLDTEENYPSTGSTL